MLTTSFMGWFLAFKSPMKRILLKLYFWIKSKIHRKMTVQQAYHLLAESRKSIYASLIATIKLTEENESNFNYIKLLEETPNPKYQVGDYVFLLVGEIKASQATMLIKTYSINTLQPEKTPFYISTLDVINDASGALYFREEKVVEVYVGRTLNAQVIGETHRFGESYFMQIHSYIKSIEAPPSNT
jgi:hypothetical protein